MEGSHRCLTLGNVGLPEGGSACPRFGKFAVERWLLLDALIPCHEAVSTLTTHLCFEHAHQLIKQLINQMVTSFSAIHYPPITQLIIYWDPVLQMLLTVTNHPCAPAAPRFWVPRRTPETEKVPSNAWHGWCITGVAAIGCTGVVLGPS